MFDPDTDEPTATAVTSTMWTEVEIHNTNSEGPPGATSDLESHPQLRSQKTENNVTTTLALNPFNAVDSSQEGIMTPSQPESDLLSTRDPQQAGIIQPSNPPQYLSTEMSTSLEEEGRLQDQTGKGVKYYAKLAAKQTFIFLRSCVGLACLVILYSLLGAAIFQALESQDTGPHFHKISDIRKTRVEELWNMTYSMNVFDGTQWSQMADKIFTTYHMEIHDLVKDRYWDGSDIVISGQETWTFTSSLLYCVTIITTIGYGHLVAHTAWGRCVTMLYAVLGIPLTLLCLARIGSFMGRRFRLLWKQILHISFKNSSRHRFSKASVGPDSSHRDSMDGMSNRTDLKVGENVTENWASSGQDGSRSISQDVDQSGDSSHDVHHRSPADLPKPYQELQIQTEVTAISSLPQPAEPQNTGFPNKKMGHSSQPVQADVTVHTESSEHSSHTHAIMFKDQAQTSQHPIQPDSGSAVTSLNQNPSINNAPGTDEPGSTHYPDPKNSSTEDTKSPEAESVIRVPITICLIVVVVYILLGAVLFSQWEGWGFFSSCYFCFISLSTIGFGDLVPGYELNGKDREAMHVVCSCYIMVGLALVAMCFELVCSEARHMFQGLVHTLGMAVQEKEK